MGRLDKKVAIVVGGGGGIGAGTAKLLANCMLPLGESEIIKALGKHSGRARGVTQ